MRRCLRLISIGMEHRQSQPDSEKTPARHRKLCRPASRGQQSVCVIVLVVCLFLPVAEASVAPGESGFVLGCNLPWLDGRMGWDIAYHPEWGYGFDYAKVDRYFADMHKMGIKVVRWWVFTDMRAGVIFDDAGIPIAVQDEVVQHMDFVMNKVCPKYGIQMYWCLISSLVDTKHFDIITKPAVRDAYFQHVVRPLAQRYRGHPSLFAWDIMNEPESDVRGRSGNWSLGRGTDWETMRTFLQECAG